MAVYEPDLPKCNFNYNGHVRKLPDYRALYDTMPLDTLIKVANTVGAFTFPLGYNLHETWVNRKKAQAHYAQRKAQAEIDIEILDGIGVHTVNLLRDINPYKRNRNEVQHIETISDSDEDDEEDEDDEDQDHITELTARIKALEDALRQLCDKYREDPMAWGIL
jgi:hypothetical protein